MTTAIRATRIAIEMRKIATPEMPAATREMTAATIAIMDALRKPSVPIISARPTSASGSTAARATAS